MHRNYHNNAIDKKRKSIGVLLLKDRKGRALSDEDVLHYKRIVVALQETIELMARIDTAIPGFPIE
ncbi:hypothetical protein [Gloeocapsopsis crepidinum]|uniref:hypothetical protein n=1 Tax=Gloeocapsopsis crepidinum TaxID=693223 RepID=UPI001D150451|nr:hypothetical protein [Gloeocapsopsis crepidinum]